MNGKLTLIRDNPEFLKAIYLAKLTGDQYLGDHAQALIDSVDALEVYVNTTTELLNNPDSTIL